MGMQRFSRPRIHSCPPIHLHACRAIMVFTDPSDWYRDLQLMTDVIMSRGVPGRHHPPADAPPVEGERTAGWLLLPDAARCTKDGPAAEVQLSATSR